jgi:NACalpha-BTF3-like transcription factor
LDALPIGGNGAERIKKVFEVNMKTPLSEIKAMYESGKSVRQIAGEVGCSFQAVQQRLAANGIARRQIQGAKTHKPFVPKEDLERVYSQSKNATEAGKALGKSQYQILEALRFWNIPLKRVGRPKKENSVIKS